MKKVDLELVERAIDEVFLDLSGPMKDDVLYHIDDWEYVEEAFRMTVRMTQQNIKNKLRELMDANL